MTHKELSELTDQELLNEAKKMKTTSIINALLIGFMIGIVVWSVAKNTAGLFTLVPLFFVYKLVNNSKNKDNDKALKDQLRARNLD